MRALTIAAGLLLLASAGGASARRASLIAPSTNALALAGAMETKAGLVTGASFPLGPSGPSAAGIGSTKAGNWFPTSGSTFAVLSTGDVTLADPPNDRPDEGIDNGVSTRNVHDPTTLRVDLNVPTGNNCLTFEFAFYSEEYPEYVGSAFNDAFLAELDRNDWSYDPASNSVTAPGNTAFDPNGKQITVNSASVTATGATGLQYDGSTVLLRASAPVTAGAHSLYFTIFDAGDGDLDSAVFLDDLRSLDAAAGTCKPGAQPVENAPSLPPAGPPVEHQSVNLKLVSGTVLVELKGTTTFLPLTAGSLVPLGSTVDTSRGRLTVQAENAPHEVESLDVYQGLAVIRQTAGKQAITEFGLTGGDFSSCKSRALAKKKPAERHLWGSGKGHFRTKGRYSSATVRGTIWFTQDTCAGTLTKVTKGVVAVNDFVTHRTVLVPAGKSYLAKPKR